jgi:hypothetical protein
MYVQGMAENERKVYEERINDLKQQIEAFRQLLLALNKQS